MRNKYYIDFFSSICKTRRGEEARNKQGKKRDMVDVYIWICDFGLLEIRLRFQDLSGPSPLVKLNNINKITLTSDL